MTPRKQDELFREIEAEQSMILQLIQQNEKLAARSDVLLNASRKKKNRESEGELEDA